MLDTPADLQDTSCSQKGLKSVKVVSTQLALLVEIVEVVSTQLTLLVQKVEVVSTQLTLLVEIVEVVSTQLALLVQNVEVVSTQLALLAEIVEGVSTKLRLHMSKLFPHSWRCPFKMSTLVVKSFDIVCTKLALFLTKKEENWQVSLTEKPSDIYKETVQLLQTTISKRQR